MVEVVTAGDEISGSNGEERLLLISQQEDQDSGSSVNMKSCALAPRALILLLWVKPGLHYL